MANKKTIMLQIRKVLQLLEEGRSERAIASNTGLSRNTIRAYRRKFQSTGQTESQLLRLADHELAILVHGETVPPIKSNRQERFDGQSEYFLKELRRVGVTRQLLWDEYRESDPDGYGYSQFCERLSLLKGRTNNMATMHIEHVAGERMQVDFAGKKLSYTDRAGGQTKCCPVVVCTLPYSGYTYVEALENASQRNLYEAMGRALSYFGGVPANVMSDNMKQFVDKPCRYEPVFNTMADQWAVHYNTALSAARVRKPKDKPSVEKEVHIAYMRVYAPLRNETFRSLAELNAGIFRCLEVHNTSPMQRYGASRRERFEQQEKAMMKPLPVSPFSIKNETKAKVQRNYHVILGEDMHQYSVPYIHVGKTVKIVYDSCEVEVFLDMQRIALHRRDPHRNGYSTKEAHMPESHLRYRQTKGWDADYFLGQSSKIGPASGETFKRVLSRNKFPEQTYNACLGFLSLAKKYGNDRFEAACQRALPAAWPTYGLIKNILENNMDKESRQPPAAGYIPPHNNLRGSEAYSFTAHTTGPLLWQ
jgi:transposase